MLSGAILFGTMLVFIAYVRQMQSAAGGLFDIFPKLKTAQASIERLQDILRCDDLVPECLMLRSWPFRQTAAVHQSASKTLPLAMSLEYLS